MEAKLTGQILVTRTVFRVWGLGLWGLGLSSVLTFDFLVEESLQDVLLPHVLQNTSDISRAHGVVVGHLAMRVSLLVVEKWYRPEFLPGSHQVQNHRGCGSGFGEFFGFGRAMTLADAPNLKTYFQRHTVGQRPVTLIGHSMGTTGLINSEAGLHVICLHSSFLVYMSYGLHLGWGDL